MPENEKFESDSDPNRTEAVCFSAGLTGVGFGAGVIHAYLAADLPAPRLVAGISLGAVTATAMERCYYDRGNDSSEAARWRWFRRYLTFILHRPYDILWDAIPNPSDFLSDLPPVAEPNLPVDGTKTGVDEGKPHDLAVEYDLQARRRLFLLAHVGRWLASVPVNMSSFAWLMVRFVRMREDYPNLSLLRVWNRIALSANFVGIFWRLARHALLSPQWFQGWAFASQMKDPEVTDTKYIRPLIGWRTWLLLLGMAIGILGWFAGLAWAGYELLSHRRAETAGSIAGLVVLLVLLAALPMVSPLLALRLLVKKQAEAQGAPARKRKGMGALGLDVLRSLGIEKSLFHNFRLRLKLFHLLADANGKLPCVPDGKKDSACKVILVAAPLQLLQESTPVQLWPDGQVPLLEGLQAALAMPGIFEPLRIEKNGRRRGQPADTRVGWVADPQSISSLDLVDGAVVRQNPLPALMKFLETEARFTGAAEPKKPRKVYLVYNVPIMPEELPPALPEKVPERERDLPDIVETGLQGSSFARRRDSRLEVVRTNHLTRVGRLLDQTLGAEQVPSLVKIAVTDIAPAKDLALHNELKPGETEILTHIAAGCRQTLSVVFRDKLRENPIDCGSFLRGLNLKREGKSEAPGCAEVCRHCCRELARAPKAIDNLLPKSFVEAPPEKLAAEFGHLDGRKPRIILLASGGVFRGSFHVGMLGGLLAANIKPDMIVGASVGSLIGSVAGSMFSQNDPDEARHKLRRLARLFVEVDERVSLTREFKAAVKDLGIRARRRSLQVSPKALSKMVAAGSRHDAGLAATGAPPALIDAISDLFLIPYQETSKIASKFVAGHIEDALQDFWLQIRKETIERLGIRDSVLGAGLIERELPLLLSSSGQHFDRFSRQPFLDHGIAFFATSVNLVTKWVRILGADLDAESYDFIEALLCSSAFPAAFAPRRESGLYPGVGRRDVFLGDGGMFDNLPFSPAYQVLGKIQRARLADTVGTETWRAELKQRYLFPDLCLVGALDAQVGKDDKSEEWDTLAKIRKRAWRLAKNEKIYGFERAASSMDAQLRRVVEAGSAPAGPLEKGDEAFLHGVVNSAVLSVYPSDETYLNGTFQFCRAMGMSQDRVRRSIGDGCFQTLFTIARAQAATGPDAPSLLGRTVANFELEGRIPRIAVKPDRKAVTDETCPFFLKSGDSGRGERFHCPFRTTSEFKSIAPIYQQCASDSGHHSMIDDFAKPVSKKARGKKSGHKVSHA